MKASFVKSCVFTISVLLLSVEAEEKCKENSRNKLFDQAFGMALTADDMLTSMMSPWRFPTFHDYFRPWRHLAGLSQDLGSTIKTDKDKFQVNLDVQHFAPDEISVKTADGYVVIETKHEEGCQGLKWGVKSCMEVSSFLELEA